MSEQVGALAGLRVLDVATLFAAPLVATQLADFGADVIKIEPPGGDFLRRLGTQLDGKSLVWAHAARGKRCITLDLETERGREILHELAAQADVLVESANAAARARWGLDYAELSAQHPRLVVVSVSCFGRSGPNAEQPGNGTLAEAYAGLTHMTGEADGPPMLASLPVGDVVSAMSGALGTIAACYHRDARGGRGQHVDVSMIDPLLALSNNSLLDHAKQGRVARRQGSRIPGAAPRNVYRASDGGWIVISAVTDRMVGKLLPAIGRDSAEDLALFATQDARRRHDDELDAAVAAWVAERPRAEALRVLREAPVPAGPVNDAADLVADAHLAARGSLTTVVDPDLGALTMAGPAPQLSATPGRVRWSGAGVGEHNAEVYGEWLDLGADELARLREAGVI